MKVLPVEDFLKVRDARSREARAAAALRRVSVGPAFTLLFENRVSVLWQIQEMCRVEGIHSPEGVQHEVDTYSALLPSRDELSATLLVEYPDPAERDRMVRRLVGLQDHVWLEVGAEKVAARFDGGQFDTERVSTVQFVRFPVPPGFADLGKSAAIVVDHPAYEARGVLSPTTRGALIEDLQAA